MKNEPKLVWMPLRGLKRAARNPKKHATPDIIASIRRFGFVDPLILNDATGKLTSGHGRLGALEKMRDDEQEPPKHIRVKGGDWLVPVLKGIEFASEAEADAYLIAVNRLVEKGGWDDDQLGEMLQGLVAEESGLQGVGYSEKDLKKLLRSESEPPLGEVTSKNTVTKMIPLYLDEPQYQVFVERLRRLSERYKTDNVTEIVQRLVADATKE